MRKQTVLYVSTAIVIAVGTIIAIFLAQGYKINLQQKQLKKNGMLIIKSTPTDAKIYVDSNLMDTTNTTMSLTPKTYHVTLNREGFSPWERNIKIQPGLAMEIDALLIPKSPQLTPLTTSGIKITKTGPDRKQIAYTTRQGEKPGLWMLDLATPPLVGLVKENPYLIAEDTETRKYSLAENLRWSPDGSELLVTLNQEGYIIVLPKNGKSKQATTSAKPIVSNWKDEQTENRQKLTNNLEIPEKLKDIAINPDTVWAPEEKKFLYTRERNNYVEYHVYNGEKPLGVGRKRDYLTFKAKKDVPIQVRWHSTSNHLIIKHGNTVILIEIEGTNKTELYSGTLVSNEIVPTPNGDNLIILTSFKKEDQPNFYAISLR